MTLVITLHFDTIIFDAAHYIPGYKGKCGNIHGHSYIVKDLRIGVDNQLDRMGISIDFSSIKQYFDKEWDHKFIVSSPPDDPYPDSWMDIYRLLDMDTAQLRVVEYTTCEHIAQVIVKELFDRFPQVRFVGFTLYEGAGESTGGVQVCISRGGDIVA